MASLVADYDSSSDQSEAGECELSGHKTEIKHVEDETSATNVYYEIGSDEDTSDDEEQPKMTLAPKSSVADKLPRPQFASSVSDCGTRGASVFANPFLAAEEAKTLALEKHVKMTANADDHPRTINGRQVCWNYRKGRCRFGHNCKFAHDSDVSSTTSEKRTSVTKSSSTTKLGRSAFKQEDGDEDATNFTRQKRKKPGLSNTLVPPKKSMKAFQKQQKQEQPWLSTLQ